MNIYIVVEDYTSAFRGVYLHEADAHEMAKTIGGGVIKYYIDKTEVKRLGYI